MKKTFNRILLIYKKRPSFFLILSCYLISIFAFLLYNLFAFAEDRVLRAFNILQTVVTQSEDTLIFTEAKLNSQSLLYSYSHDPQIEIADINMRVDTVKLCIDYITSPGETCVYYTDNRHPDFSLYRRSFGTEVLDGVFFKVNKNNVSALRIDPASKPGKIGNFISIIINPKQNFFEYFAVTPRTIYFLTLLPLAVAALFYSVFVGEDEKG